MNGGTKDTVREAAAGLFARYMLLNGEEKRAFDDLIAEWRRPQQHHQTPVWLGSGSMLLSSSPSALTYENAAVPAPAPAPAPVVVQRRSDPPLMVTTVRAAQAKDEEEKQASPALGMDHEDDNDLSEEPLDERCVNVCTPKTECACRYKLTEREETVPKLDYKTVAVFFPNAYHSDWQEGELRQYVQNLVRAVTPISSLVRTMYAVPGRQHRGVFVIPYVLVQCPTHAHAVRIYQIIRRAIARDNLSISLNWGRKRNV